MTPGAWCADSPPALAGRELGRGDFWSDAGRTPRYERTPSGGRSPSVGAYLPKFSSAPRGIPSGRQVTGADLVRTSGNAGRTEACAPSDQPEAKGTSVVGEIITIGTAIAAVVAAIAKPAFDYLKVRALANKAKPVDIPKIANAAFPRYELGPLRRGPVDQAGDGAPDDVQQDDDEGPGDGDGPPGPPPNS